MVRTSFDGREIIKALTSYDFRIVGRKGSHVKLRLDRPDLSQPRVVTVPLKDRDRISRDTHRSIAEQCGANDFHEWCAWIEENC